MLQQSAKRGGIHVNASNYTDTYSVSPRVSQVSGPTSVTSDDDSHHLAVVTCDFTANG